LTLLIEVLRKEKKLESKVTMNAIPRKETGKQRKQTNERPNKEDGRLEGWWFPRHSSVSGHLYTGPDKFLQGQKLARFHLAFTWDRRNWTDFWSQLAHLAV